MSDTKMRPILLGEAEVIDQLQPDVRGMIDNPGLYLCGDSKTSIHVVPVWSSDGKLYSMQIDQELDPERFLGTNVVHGGPLLPTPPTEASE